MLVEQFAQFFQHLFVKTWTKAEVHLLTVDRDEGIGTTPHRGQDVADMSIRWSLGPNGMDFVS